jgi:hypothetical protein
MSSATQTRKPVKPVSGSVKLLRPFGAVNDTTAEVPINGKASATVEGSTARLSSPVVHRSPAA